MRTEQEERAIRQDVFRWLDDKLGTGQYELTRTELENYHYGAQRIPLVDRNRGIRNPADFSATLSVMTSANGPYEDQVSPDGLVRYQYRNQEGGDNVKLRRAFELRMPLIRLQRIRDGVFVADYPAFIVADERDSREVVIALYETLTFFADPLHMATEERAYAERLVRSRLHQPLFRARIMRAYDESCAVCRLRHPQLLDAAHIIPDVELEGLAVTSNGLSLCKIHHAAYDKNLMGITPDYEVRIDHALLDEIDGPMLRHGLQDMHGTKISVPRRVNEQPSKDALARRFAEFAA